MGGMINDSYSPQPAVMPSSDSPTYQQDADDLFVGAILRNWPIRDEDTDTQRELVQLYPLDAFPNNQQRVGQASQDVIFEW